MATHLEELIKILDVIATNNGNKELKKDIATLESMPAEVDDNKVSGNIIALITAWPELINDPRFGDLKALCLKLKPTHIKNVPDEIWNKLIETYDYKPAPKKGFGSK